MTDDLKMRAHGDASLPTLVYLPGMHGDWTLVSSFRAAIAGRVRFVEFTYPRTTTWSLDDYAATLRRVFARYEIPCFLDRREPMTHHPLAELTRYALRTAAFNWRQPDWFGALKTDRGLLPLIATCTR